MSIKPRSPGQTAISISLPESLVAQVEERAQALGLSRSQYLVQLARADLKERGALTLHETPNSTPDVQKAEAETVRIAQQHHSVSYGKPARKKSAK